MITPKILHKRAERGLHSVVATERGGATMVLRRESAIEYFKELVDGALANQHLEAGELTAFYIVRLLSEFAQRAAAARENEPLGPKLIAALNASGMRQRTTLKEVGDASLFISGFFSDSLRRTRVDVDYYMAIGGQAYNALSRHETDTFSSVFAELGDKFAAFVDVLNEVSERTSCTSNRDLLRLYEKWLRTGSRRSGQLLVERGVVPNASIPDLVQ